MIERLGVLVVCERLSVENSVVFFHESIGNRWTCLCPLLPTFLPSQVRSMYAMKSVSGSAHNVMAVMLH